MAGDWIKVRTDLGTSPKVVRIASALCTDRLRVIGALHAVWCLFDAHSCDGELAGYAPETLDELIAFPGFAAAMVAVAWLEVRENGLFLPQFDAHNGASAKRRAMEADRKRSARASASGADKKRTREEKRREEKKTEGTPPEKPERKPRAKPKTACPEALPITAEMAAWAAEHAPAANLSRETARFCNYWRSRGELRADWLAGWRNWFLKAQDYAEQRDGGGTAGGDSTDWRHDLGGL